MNLTEFAALKVGDHVDSPMNDRLALGTVVETTPSGVRVTWGKSETRFFYSVNTTAWMHWVKA